MNERMVRALTGRSFRWCEATLYDYKRLMVRGEDFPGIIPSEGDLVRGRLYFDIDYMSLKRLDEYEGEFYELRDVTVFTEDGMMISAYAYVVKDAFRHILVD